jgi:hypothetical protein
MPRKIVSHFLGVDATIADRHGVVLIGRCCVKLPQKRRWQGLGEPLRPVTLDFAKDTAEKLVRLKPGHSCRIVIRSEPPLEFDAVLEKVGQRKSIVHATFLPMSGEAD